MKYLDLLVKLPVAPSRHCQWHWNHQTQRKNKPVLKNFQARFQGANVTMYNHMKNIKQTNMRSKLFEKLLILITSSGQALKTTRMLQHTNEPARHTICHAMHVVGLHDHVWSMHGHFFRCPDTISKVVLWSRLSRVSNKSNYMHVRV